ncbi:MULTISPECIES: zinc-ribbon domain-containing protein [unclassified Butyrivibrio]|uniref:zinc-ribbon domain-containing protein n=1 Tax=unclassified Butyrivibrio TaxID=2639466 RepID=UPI0003B4D5EA|nr:MULTISPECIES: zinc-ribbon domain-containing protein [unclassified Butyrivibrio]
MKCSNCGNEIEPGARYCNVCGFFIVPEDESVEITEPVVPKQRKGVVLLLAALFVLLGLLVTAYILPQIIKYMIVEKQFKSEMNAVEVQDEEDEETEEEEFQGLSALGEPGDKLMMVDEIIYNDQGGVITGIYDGESRVGDFYVNEAQNAGVLYDSRKICLYITPDLNTVPLAENVYDAGLSYSGDYVFYKIIDQKFNKYLYLYDVKTGDEYKVEETDTTEMVMSPSGEYIAYIKHDELDYNKKLLTISGWGLKPAVLTGDVDEIYAVSDDGKMIVYSTYKDGSRTLFCWDDGNIVQLADDYVVSMHFNRDCSFFLYEGENGVYCFEPGMDEPMQLIGGMALSVRIDGKRQKVSPRHVNRFLYASKTLTGAMIKTTDGLYMLKDNMELMRADDDAYGALLINRLEDKDICVYYDGHGLAYNIVGFDGSITTINPIGEGFPGGYAINDDGSVLWYYDSNEEQVYMVDMTTGSMSTVFGKVTEKGTISLLYDSYTQRCFFISEDGCCYGASADGDILEFATDCAEPYTSYRYDDMVGYKEKSREGYNHILVFGRFVELSN